jgi:hypothetical protein
MEQVKQVEHVAQFGTQALSSISPSIIARNEAIPD